jgi:hypothetical protein
MTERASLPALQKFLLFLMFPSFVMAAVAFAQTGATSPQKQTQPPSARKPRVAKRPVSDATAASLPKVCPACIQAHMNFLASDALRGRGSGTPDELLAATYVGAQLEQYGIEPAGDDGTYIQRATVVQEKLTAAPRLKFMTPGDGIPADTVLWTHGKEMLALHLSDTKFRGPLKRVNADSSRNLKQTSFSYPGAPRYQDADQNRPGSVVLILGKDREKVRAAVSAALDSGAAAVLEPASSQLLNEWEVRGKQLPTLPPMLEGGIDAGLGKRANVFALGKEALASLNGIPDGTTFYFEAALDKPEKSYTWNALGKITGADPALNKSALLLSAHLDHLGVGQAVNGDSIYNGADDDASGTVAVLELGRVLGSKAKPKRTVLFALFGSEEPGGLGSAWFQAHPPLPLSDIAVNLEFEMIGRPDPKYAADSLWLTGWERSNLGPALAAHGAKLLRDTRPERHFFMRSDNYVLAKKGVVAQTVSSYGLHDDYHQPSDDLAHINFKHMNTVIGSLIAPVMWLVNSNFKPQWNAGGKP